MEKYGHGTPDDWIERNLYSKFSWQGVALLLILDFILFGAKGITVWAVQMLWIPVTAAGIINGIGHWWGYRNYDCADAATNIIPWGIIIGGEELHNNHHTYATSAKLSSKWYEFDIGWGYIRAMEMIGMAKVKKMPPKPKFDPAKVKADFETLQSVIANRYDVMAKYAKSVKHAWKEELAQLKDKSQLESRFPKSARKLLQREPAKLEAPQNSSWWNCSSIRKPWKPCTPCVLSWACCGSVRTSAAMSWCRSCKTGASARKLPASSRCKSSRCACAAMLKHR